MVPSPDAPPGAFVASTRHCILVVEDELIIRLMVSEELRDAGFDVVEAFNADEALAALASRVRIDLIFSDVRMPGSINGLGLLAVVKERFPALPVIMASGDLGPDSALTDATQFLAKPYTLEAVVSAVRGELAKSNG